MRFRRNDFNNAMWYSVEPAHRKNRFYAKAVDWGVSYKLAHPTATGSQIRTAAKKAGLPPGVLAVLLAILPLLLKLWELFVAKPSSAITYTAAVQSPPKVKSPVLKRRRKR